MCGGEGQGAEGQKSRKSKGSAGAKDPYGREVRVKVKDAGSNHGDCGQKKGSDASERPHHTEHSACIIS